MFLKLLLGFSPWLAFLFIAHGSLLRLKIGLVVALILAVVLGIMRIHRGIILWIGLAFFSYALVAVLVFENMWAVRFMGVLANGALALGAWTTLALGKPFTLDYARDHTDPALWGNPVFLRTNTVITSVWALVFTANALIALSKALAPLMPDWGYDLTSYALLLCAMLSSVWYPALVRRRAEGQHETADKPRFRG